jgi:RimJ/RimL family protein N-acetyltransferase
MIETERLVLRRPALQDLEGYVRLFGDPDVMRYLSLEGRPMSRYGARQAFCGQVGHWELRGYGIFTVLERATGQFVGRVGPWFPEGWPGFEVGWALLSEFWGRGYATEAARASLDFAFSELRQEKVISLVMPDNVRSSAVALRLGEQFLGDMTLPHHGSDRKTNVFGMSREEWQSRSR